MATLLLLVFPQEPAMPKPLSGAEVLPTSSAHDEFRDWLGEATQHPVLPIHVEYEVNASLGLFDPNGGVKATFGGEMTSDLLTESKLRHHLKGLVVFGNGKEIPLEMILTLDGESFWLALSAEGMRSLPEGGVYITGKLSAFQEAYRFAIDYQQWGVDHKEVFGEGGMIGLGEHFTAYVQSFPENGVNLLHPSVLMHYGLAPFRCQKMEREGAALTASMALDTRPEAFMVELAAQWHALWSGMFGDPDREDSTSKAFQILGDHMDFTVGFDASSAMPKSLSIDFDINAETLGLGTAEEAMALAAEVSQKVSHTKTIDPSLFAAPRPNQVPTDVTGLLEMALNQMKNEKAEEESKLDGDF